MISPVAHCGIRGMVLAFCLLNVVGCVSTPDEIRKADRQITFTVNENYRQVYAKALTQARKCYQMNSLGSDISVNGDLLPEAQSGEIAIVLHRGLGADAQRLISVKAIDDTHSTVVGTFASGPVDRLGQTLKGWFSNGPTAC